MSSCLFGSGKPLGVAGAKAAAIALGMDQKDLTLPATELLQKAKIRFRQLALQNHPDKSAKDNAGDAFHRVKEAKDYVDRYSVIDQSLRQSQITGTPSFPIAGVVNGASGVERRVGLGKSSPFSAAFTSPVSPSFGDGWPLSESEKVNLFAHAQRMAQQVRADQHRAARWAAQVITGRGHAAAAAAAAAAANASQSGPHPASSGAPPFGASFVSAAEMFAKSKKVTPGATGGNGGKSRAAYDAARTRQTASAKSKAAKASTAGPAAKSRPVKKQVKKTIAKSAAVPPIASAQRPNPFLRRDSPASQPSTRAEKCGPPRIESLDKSAKAVKEKEGVYIDLTQD